MNVFVACFDVTDDRARRRIGDRLEHFGTRVQKSVFEISVRSSAELDALREELQAELDDGDDLRFYALCANCRRNSQHADGERVALFPAAIIL